MTRWRRRPRPRNGALRRVGCTPRITARVWCRFCGGRDACCRETPSSATRCPPRARGAVEPPLLDAGGHIVKRMGDGLMAVFRDPTVALRAVLAADEALRSVEVAGHTPRMRVGIHTGRPQRMAADWLGVDVNIAARVMERATKGGIMVSSSSLDQIPQTELDAMGVVAKRARKPVF